MDGDGGGGMFIFNFMFKGTIKFLTMGFAGWEWDTDHKPIRIQLAM
jgi:hypothetical protein